MLPGRGGATGGEWEALLLLFCSQNSNRQNETESLEVSLRRQQGEWVAIGALAFGATFSPEKVAIKL